MAVSGALSQPQRHALACLAQGPLIYTVAGYSRGEDCLDYVAVSTMNALERRGLASIKGPYRRRVAVLTPLGRDRQARERGEAA
jgi:hypothetical protein